MVGYKKTDLTAEDVDQIRRRLLSNRIKDRKHTGKTDQVRHYIRDFLASNVEVAEILWKEDWSTAHMCAGRIHNILVEMGVTERMRVRSIGDNVYLVKL